MSYDELSFSTSHERSMCGTARACSPARAFNVRDSTRVLSRTRASTWRHSVHVLMVTGLSSRNVLYQPNPCHITVFPAREDASFISSPVCCGSAFVLFADDRIYLLRRAVFLFVDEDAHTSSLLWCAGMARI